MANQYTGNVGNEDGLILIGLLEDFKQGFGRLDELIRWESLTAGDFTDEDFPQILTCLREIDHHYLMLREFWRDFSPAMSTFPGLSDERYQLIVDKIEPRKGFHRRIWLPVLIGGSAPGFRRLLREEGGGSASGGVSKEIAITLSAALEFWDETIEPDDHRRVEGFDFDGAHRFLDFAASDADAWMARADRVRPILLKKRMLPAPLQARLDELYTTLVQGNFLAAIALGRATLEYMLRDNLSIDGRIGQLIEEAENVYPALRDVDVQLIQRWGNQTMHPRTGIESEMLPNEDKAIRCLITLQRAAEIIYRKARPERA